MKLTISAQDKPVQKVFDYQLDFDPDTILKMTVLICGTVVAVSLLSLLKEKKKRKGEAEWFCQILKKT